MIRAKLDQKRKTVEVSFAMGRDVQDEEIKSIIETQERWCEACESLLGSLHTQILTANKAREAHTAQRAAIDASVSR